MTSPAADHDVHEVLSGMLLVGAFPPGTKLGEMELAGIFGVSRERIRKVLQRLGTERLIEVIPNRGAFVASPTLAAAREIYDARRMLEGGLLMTLATTLTTAQLAELDQHLNLEREAAEQGDRPREARLSGDFHLMLARFADNDYIARFTQEMVSRTSMLVAFFERSTPACGHREHAGIVDALRRRDGPLAAERGTTHLSLIETRLRITEQAGPPEADLAALIKARQRELKAAKASASSGGRKSAAKPAAAAKKRDG